MSSSSSSSSPASCRAIPPVRWPGGRTPTRASWTSCASRWGLDKPVWQQFGDYLVGLLHGDLGYAWHTGHPVAQDFATRFPPATVELALAALFLGVVVGVPLGILSAMKRGRLVDHLTRVISLLGVSMPLFWLGLLVISLFFGTLAGSPHRSAASRTTSTRPPT